MGEPTRGGAHISACGRYRYNLWRGWGSGPHTSEAPLFVMLNPSTADATTDDATIRKCIGFADRWGFCSLTVVNVFALRATDPKELYKAQFVSLENAIGPDNDDAIISAVQSHGLIVAAWGATAEKVDQARVKRVRNLLGPRVVCLGQTKEGHPRHPLYVPYTQAPTPLPHQQKE